MGIPSKTRLRFLFIGIQLHCLESEVSDDNNFRSLWLLFRLLRLWFEVRLLMSSLLVLLLSFSIVFSILDFKCSGSMVIFFLMYSPSKYGCSRSPCARTKFSLPAAAPVRKHAAAISNMNPIASWKASEDGFIAECALWVVTRKETPSCVRCHEYRSANRMTHPGSWIDKEKVFAFSHCVLLFYRRVHISSLPPFPHWWIRHVSFAYLYCQC